MIADDWSFPHAGVLDDPVVRTPTFDKLATTGVHFANTFAPAPSCSPCRAAILAGQHPWRLQTAANLGGSLHAETPVFTDLLQASGYLVGKSGKGHWPSNHSYREKRPLPEGHVSLAALLKQRRDGQPFFYWYGGADPHRPYKNGTGVESGMDPGRVRLPKCLPDTAEVRADLCDYYWEIQRFDRRCGEIIALLDEAGEADSTMLVITSDNGMPFPRAKATLYDLGVRVPMAIMWPGKAPGQRTVTDFVSLHDLAPTFLQAAGVAVPKQMNGRSLMPLLTAKRTGRIDPSRDHVIVGMERHVECNPQRAIRTDEFLLIRNLVHNRWPEPAKTPYNYNIDPSPSKSALVDGHAAYPELFRLAFEPRPEFELYRLNTDPEQMRNLAHSAEHAEVLRSLAGKLEHALAASGDPRASSDKGFEHYRGPDHRQSKTK
jgi:arylsulfatase A-like enzyme